MTERDKLACHLAQDLLIPYLAGDVSNETRGWLEQHLSECADCRAALGMARPALPSAGAPSGQPTEAGHEPTTAAAEKLLRRVKTRNTVIMAILILAAVSLISLMGLTFWGMSVFRSFTLPLPADHPIPAASVSPKDVAGADLSSLGLTPAGTNVDGQSASAIWLDPANHRIRVAFTRSATAAAADRAFQSWVSQFPIRIASWENHRPGRSSVMARTPRTYIYGWQTDNCLVTIQVPSGAAEAASLCTSIRDALFRAFAEMGVESGR